MGLYGHYNFVIFSEGRFKCDAYRHKILTFKDFGLHTEKIILKMSDIFYIRYYWYVRYILNKSLLILKLCLRYGDKNPPETKTLICEIYISVTLQLIKYAGVTEYTRVEASFKANKMPLKLKKQFVIDMLS